MGPPQISSLIPSFDGSVLGGLISAAGGLGNLIIDSTANFFVTIGNYLSMFWDVVQGTVANTGALLRTIFTAVSVTNTIQPLIWAPIAASMTIVILVAVVKVVLGWGNT